MSIGRRLPTGTAGCAVLLVLALGTVSRPGLWADEAATVWIADRPLPDLLRVLGREEANMGPYYLVVNGWMRLGDSDAWVRALSIPFGLVAVAVTAAVVHRWTASRLPAVATGVVLAVSPMMRHYVVEARCYAMVAACAAVALWAVERRDGVVRIRPVVLGLSVGTATALGLTAITSVLAPLALLVALGGVRANRRRLAGAALVAAAVVAPFVPAFASNPNQLTWLGQVPLSTAYRTSLMASPALTALLWACVVLSLAAGAVLLRRRSEHDVASLALASGIGALAPFLALVVGSWVLQPLFVPRYAMTAVPAVAICVVLGPWLMVTALGGAWVRGTAIAVAGLVAIVSFATVAPWEDRVLADDPESAAGLLVSRAREGDTVVLARRWYWWALARYGIEDTAAQVVSTPSGHGRLSPGPRVLTIDETTVDTDRVVWWETRSGDLPTDDLLPLWQELQASSTARRFVFGQIVVIRFAPRQD